MLLVKEKDTPENYFKTENDVRYGIVLGKGIKLLYSISRKENWKSPRLKGIDLYALQRRVFLTGSYRQMMPSYPQDKHVGYIRLNKNDYRQLYQYFNRLLVFEPDRYGQIV